MNSTGKNVSIRKLRSGDAEQIGNIYARITHNSLNEDFQRLVEEHAQREDDVCLVAELEGRIIGFMITYILTLGFGIEKSAWIATLGVEPKYMGQGVGAKMAREVFELYKSQGIVNVYTAVRWDSVDLLSFFKTLGFDRSKFINLRKSLK